MKKSFKTRIAVSAAAFAMAVFVAVPAMAQEESGRRRPVPTGKTPRTADGKVDFTGVWGNEHTFIYDISVSLDKGETLPRSPGQQN